MSNLPPPIRTPLAERFWSKVDRRGPTDCWTWLGAPSRDGYGTIAEGGKNGRMLKAHRVAYELVVGPIPEGLTIDHLCRNRLCVNPSHLEPVTAVENSNRRREVATHCKHGHEYTPGNTRYTTQGYRFCRTCRRRTERNNEAKKRAAQAA